ncbi:hypothetical protein EHR25_25070, partial [Escherichia coli]|nr:hypothetical protein [Escherichia coli]
RWPGWSVYLQILNAEHQANKNGSREYLFLSGNSSFVSIYIDGRDCCQTGQFSQDVADGALTSATHTLHYPITPE